MASFLQRSFALSSGQRMDFSAETFEAGENPMDKQILTPLQIAALHKIVAQGQLMAMNLSAESMVALGGLMQSINMLSTSLARYGNGTQLTSQQQEIQSTEMRSIAANMQDHLKSAQTVLSSNPQLQATLASSLSLLNTVVPQKTKAGQIVRIAVVRDAKAVRPAVDTKVSTVDRKNLKNALAVDRKPQAAQISASQRTSATILGFNRTQPTVVATTALRTGSPSASRSAAVIQFAKGVASDSKLTTGAPLAAKSDAPQAGTVIQPVKTSSPQTSPELRSTEATAPRATQASPNIVGNIPAQPVAAVPTTNQIGVSPAQPVQSLQTLSGTDRPTQQLADVRSSIPQQFERAPEALSRTATANSQVVKVNADPANPASIDMVAQQPAPPEGSLNTVWGAQIAVVTPAFVSDSLSIFSEQSLKIAAPAVARPETIIASPNQAPPKQGDVPPLVLPVETNRADVVQTTAASTTSLMQQPAQSTEADQSIVTRASAALTDAIGGLIAQFKKAATSNCEGCDGSKGCCNRPVLDAKSMGSRIAQLKK